MTHKQNNQSFFYTFGTSDSFPYKRGWVEVQAPDREEADKTFRSKFPDRTPGILNCADIYDQMSFDSMLARTEMPAEWKVCHEVITSEQFARPAFDKPFWAELRNDYFTDDFYREKDGAIRACISIDAWKTLDDNEEGEVIARVILSEHGDILVDYLDNVARYDAAARESIQDAIQQMKEYAKEQGIDPHETGVTDMMRSQKVSELSHRVLKCTDYDMLYAQKLELLEYLEKGTPPSKQAMEGLVNLLETMGDLGEAQGLFQYDGIEPPFPMQEGYQKKIVIFGDKPAPAKDLAMSLYEQMRETHNKDNSAYYIAKNLAYLAGHAEPDKDVPLDTLYQISARLYDVAGDQPLLNEERLDAIRTLLENGLTFDLGNGPEACADVCLKPEQVPDFLLQCDPSAFVYLVESTAYENQERYCSDLSPNRERTMMDDLLKELRTFNGAGERLETKLAGAKHRTGSEHQSTEMHSDKGR